MKRYIARAVRKEDGTSFTIAEDDKYKNLPYEVTQKIRFGQFDNCKKVSIYDTKKKSYIKIWTQTKGLDWINER